MVSLAYLKTAGITVMTLLGLLTAAEVSVALAVDFRICDDCHFERLEQDRGQYYQHQAFAGNECSACHMTITVPEFTEVSPPPQQSQQQRISWLADSPLSDNSHYFWFADEGLRETLVVSLRNRQGQVHLEEVPVPPLSQLESVHDNGKIPQLSNVRVVEVRRGVFLNVTIAWQTDVLTAAEVRYGPLELNQHVDSGGRLGYEHQLILNQLEPDSSYHYQVAARDVFGRTAQSEVLGFSTSRASIVKTTSDTAAPQHRGDPGPTVSFARHDDGFFVEVGLEQPFMVSAGTRGERRSVSAPTFDGSASAGRDPHTDLSHEIWRSLESCHQCHVKDLASSHPVNVLPRPGMIIPPEYPTLADGRITCVSCHTVHGADRQWLTRKRSNRELCVGCHQDML